jgi:hypothetical protein
MKNILFYISSHGLGHFARDIIVIKYLLDKGYYIHILSGVKQNIIIESLKNYSNFKYHKKIYDTGCYQKNFVDIDIKKTVSNLISIHKQNLVTFKNEIQFIKKNNIDIIISDAASFPIYLAYKSKLPGILFSNFTWYDIYKKFNIQNKNFKVILNKIKKYYSYCSCQYLPGNSNIPNNYISKKKEIGYICDTGKNIKKILNKKYNIKNKKICFIYLGQFDNTILNWINLEKIKNFIFITKDKINIKLNNLIQLGNEFKYSDLIASCDIVCTKLGYSTVSLSLKHKKPLIYCSRKHFEEFYYIQNTINKTNTGIMLNDNDFFNCLWQKALNNALKLNSNYACFKFNGEIEMAREITRIVRHRLSA